MPPQRPPVVPRTVKGLGAVSLLNDLASEMVYPLLPALMTRTLGAGAMALGALDGAADLTAALLRFASGRLADRQGWRKPLILMGYGAAVVVRPVIALAASAWQVIGLRVLDRVGKGLRTPARDAMIAEVTPAAQHGRAFGFHRAADHLGAVAGSLAAWFLLTQGSSVPQVIAWSAVPGFLAMLVLSRTLRMAPAAVDNPVGDQADDQGTARFWTPAVVLAVLAVGRLPETLLLLRLQDLGVAVAMVPLAWGALHVVRSLAAYPGGWLNDHIGPRITITLGALLFAAVSVGLSRPLGAGGAVAVFLGLGVVSGLTEGAERAVVARIAPRQLGRGFGSFQGVAGLMALPAAVFLGWVYESMGGPVALVVSAGVLGAGAVTWAALSLVPSRRGP